ncbi:MAG: DUF805 domain-containing protein [Pseudomonadota bacterium]
MGLPHHYIIALISPMGRLSQVPFVALAFLLGMTHIWIFAKIAHENVPLDFNAYTIAIFVMLWMQFCIFTRRMKDTGSSGMWFIPLTLLIAFIYACILDPSLSPFDRQATAADGIIDQWGLRFVRGLFFAIFIYAVKAGGEDGPNAYGPEFGDVDDNKPAKPNRTRKSKSTATQTVADVQNSQYAFVLKQRRKGPDWGARQRPAGFGRR